MHKLQVPDLKSKAICRLKCLKPVFFFMVCRVLLQWFQKYLQFYISLWEDIIGPPFFFFCSLQGSLGLTLSLTLEKTHHAILDLSSTSIGSLGGGSGMSSQKEDQNRPRICLEIPPLIWLGSTQMSRCQRQRRWLGRERSSLIRHLSPQPRRT